MPLRKSILAILLFFSPAVVAQQMDKKLLFTLPDTSNESLMKAELSLGLDDEFCYYYHGDTLKLVTNSKTYGPFTHEENYRNVVCHFYNEKNKDQYLHCKNSTQVYGPYDGILNYENTVGEKDVAYTVSFDDSIHYYISGNLIARTERFAITDRGRGFANSWCSLSENGNALYTIEKGRWKYLFVNGKIVDSSLYHYGRLQIDNEGNYCYWLGNFVVRKHFLDLEPIPHKAKKGNYKPAHGEISGYRPEDTLFHCGSISTDKLLSLPPFNKPLDSLSVTTVMKGPTTFTYKTSAWEISDYSHTPPGTIPTTIWVNGVAHELPYQEIILPCIDSMGHYALFGLRDYYLYRNINGKEEKIPLSKHGVRAKPISIDVHGNTICYYETDDSVFVYENDRLFGKCAFQEFEIDTHNGSIWRNDGWTQQYLPIISIGNNSYVVYNNLLSPPLLNPATKPYSRRNETDSGEAAYARVNPYGYWLLQKKGTQKYDLIINHKRIVLPTGLNFENPLGINLAKNCSLDANGFVLYTMEGNNIWRYKIRL